MILAQPTQWISRRTMIAASATFAFVAFAFLQVSQKEAGFMLDSGIRVPVPFMQQESSLQGKVTYYGTRNGIDIYEVTYRNGELYENLMPDRIYLVHVPNTPDVIDSPLDVVMSSVTTGSRNVNYYGYRYSDAAATMERRDIYATRFADRFPGQFFASNKARTEDAKFGNMLGAFEQERGVVFRKTDGSAGSVRLDPAGALYAMIVNEDGGASFSVRKSGICGNNNLDLGEECDDGNTVNADSCTNMCTFGLPIPFDSGNTATGTKLSITTDTVATTGLAVHGQTGVTLVRFSVGATEDVRFTKLVVRADTGSLADAMHYTLWKDTDGNGQVDQVAQANVAPQGGFLTFDTIGASNGQLIAKNKSMVFQIVADIVASPTQKTLRVVVATATADYVGGFRVSPAVALAGIRTNGVCGQAVCQMEVVTKPSTLYSFVAQPQCGNGTKEPPEQCDDGNQSNTDTCTNICKDAVCGDTFKQGTEACDDGNTASGDGCSATCQVETANPVCGNGTKEGTEQCDDGNTLSGDGCSSTCQTETPNPVCGNGTREGSETCDDGNTTAGDGCSATCAVESGYTCNTATPNVCTPGGNPVCGNGTKEGSEQCDDGNQSNTDSCTNACLNAACGDTFKQGTEQCDDGNTASGDGCSATCTTETSNPVCGNGTKEGSEQCDDGNQSNTDSCTNACLNAACGDTFKQGTEECDDGNTASGDGCSATCTTEPLPDAPLTINVKTLPATSSATVGQTDLTFVRFDAVAGDAEVLLQGVMFKAATGSLAMISNPSLWRDTTGDGVGDVKVLDKAGTSTPTTLVFFAASSSANRLIAAGQTVTFEVRGDIASDVQAPAVVRLGFKTSLANFVTALDTVANQDLSGIATDGICLFTCDIEVFDKLSTLWNISSGTGLACGNGVIEAAEQCDDGDAASGDGCSDACAKESEFRCTGEPSVCISYLDYVKELADTNNNDVVSDNEALILTLDVADAPDRPFAEVSQYDMDQDGDVDSVDVAIILTQLDILAP